MIDKSGFIVLWRKFMDTSFYKDSQAVHLAIHLIQKANHKDETIIFNGIPTTITRGQLITGRLTLSEETGIHESSIYRKLVILQKVGFLNIKPNNKFSIITICKYSDYQDKPTHKRTTERTTSEQPANTNNNVNNDNNKKISLAEEVYAFYSKTIKAGSREDAIRNIEKILKTGTTQIELLSRIKAYRDHLDKTKADDPRYYIQANNFFGRAARYLEFEPTGSRYKPVDPNCKVCNGTGFMYVEAINANQICTCRIKK